MSRLYTDAELADIARPFEEHALEALRRGDLIVQAAWAALRGGGDFIVVHPLLKGGRERVEEAAERGNNEERRDDHAGKLMQAR